MANLFKKLANLFLDFVQTIVLGLSLFVVVYLFLLQPHQVKGLSMMPSFQNSEMLLTDKVSYRFGSPSRGDVVIFRAPPSEPCADIECEYIKRLIGLPGEKIKIENGAVLVNGVKLMEPYLSPNAKTTEGHYLEDGIEKMIPEGNYLFLGDNREHSRDGREFGPIPKESLVGKAWLRYWPFDRFSALKGISY